MVYSEVIYGAKAILPYEYSAPGGLAGSPTLLAEYQTLVKEVLSLKNWFLNGTLQDDQRGND